MTMRPGDTFVYDPSTVDMNQLPNILISSYLSFVKATAAGREELFSQLREGRTVYYPQSTVTKVILGGDISTAKQEIFTDEDWEYLAEECGTLTGMTSPCVQAVKMYPGKAYITRAGYMHGVYNMKRNVKFALETVAHEERVLSAVNLFTYGSEIFAQLCAEDYTNILVQSEEAVDNFINEKCL